MLEVTQIAGDKIKEYIAGRELYTVRIILSEGG